MSDRFTGEMTWGPARLALALLLCCAALAGCGDSGRQAVKYYDIQSETEEVFPGKADGAGGGMFLGMQYYRGEVVQLWSEGKKLYLCREDGSRELLMEVPGIAAMLCFLDGDGSCYSWGRHPDLYEGAPAVRKYDASGKEVCSAALPDGALPAGICQLADGSIVLLLQSEDAQYRTTSVLAELDSDRGILSPVDGVQLAPLYGYRYIAAGATGVLVLEDGPVDGVREVGMEDSAILREQNFSGTSYSFESKKQKMQVQDFRMLEDGGIEILWADPATGRGTRESLRMAEIEKIPVVVGTSYLVEGDKLKQWVNRFNSANDTYYAVLEYPGITYDEQMDYIRRTGVEIGTGGGPDVLAGYLLYALGEASLAEKGGLVDFAPYMKRSGIREGDYFPGAFGYLRDGGRIYTVSLDARITYRWTDASVLGGLEEPDVETLVDALAAWRGGGSYDEYPVPSREILQTFLCGSEDLWGMADWERGTCDFGGGLFGKMLEVARKYGESYAHFYAAHSAGSALERTEGLVLGGYKTVQGVFDFDSDAQLWAEGKVRSGYLFDGGCRAVYGGLFGNDKLAVNSGSAVKEGAWEFIRFVLSEDFQRHEEWPVHRAIHMEKVEKELRELAAGTPKYSSDYQKRYLPGDITEEWVEEYARTMDEARHLPVRTQALVDIICEEAEYYFDGVKSMDEVIKIIENRVGLYIGEHR